MDLILWQKSKGCSNSAFCEKSLTRNTIVIVSNSPQALHLCQGQNIPRVPEKKSAGPSQGGMECKVENHWPGNPEEFLGITDLTPPYFSLAGPGGHGLTSPLLRFSAYMRWQSLLISFISQGSFEHQMPGKGWKCDLLKFRSQFS